MTNEMLQIDQSLDYLNEAMVEAEWRIKNGRRMVREAVEDRASLVQQMADLRRKRSEIALTVPAAAFTDDREGRGRRLTGISLSILGAMTYDLPLSGSEISLRCGVPAKRVRTSLAYLMGAGYVVKHPGSPVKWTRA